MLMKRAIFHMLATEDCAPHSSAKTTPTALDVCPSHYWEHLLC